MGGSFLPESHFDNPIITAWLQPTEEQIEILNEYPDPNHIANYELGPVFEHCTYIRSHRHCIKPKENECELCAFAYSSLRLWITYKDLLVKFEDISLHYEPTRWCGSKLVKLEKLLEEVYGKKLRWYFTKEDVATINDCIPALDQAKVDSERKYPDIAFRAKRLIQECKYHRTAIANVVHMYSMDELPVGMISQERLNCIVYGFHWMVEIILGLGNRIQDYDAVLQRIAEVKLKANHCELFRSKIAIISWIIVSVLLIAGFGLLYNVLYKHSPLC